MNQRIVLYVVAVAVIALGVWLFVGKPLSETPNPSLPTPTEDGLVEVSLDERVSERGITLTVHEVLEDSRCPIDAVCIQMGTVRVRATLMSGLGTANQVFELQKPVTTEAEEITLVQVDPAPRSDHAIQKSEYRFHFTITKR
jgi:hypothetical protein